MTKRNNQSVTACLQQALADSYAVYSKTHLYHWNITGVQFAALHTLFEEQYTELWQALDELAERLRALDVAVAPSYKTASEIAGDKDSAKPDAPTMLQALAKAQEQLIASLNTGVSVAEEAGDVGTADLLTARLQVAEKSRWMLLASL